MQTEDLRSDVGFRDRVWRLGDRVCGFQNRVVETLFPYPLQLVSVSVMTAMYWGSHTNHTRQIDTYMGPYLIFLEQIMRGIWERLID